MEIIAAVIGALAVVWSSIYAAKANKRELAAEKALDSLEKAVGRSSRESAESSSAAAYTLDLFEKETEFDETGGGTVTRRWIGLGTTHEFQNLKIAFRGSFECEGAIVEQPTARELSQSPLVVSIADVSVAALPGTHKLIVVGNMVVSGHLTPATGPVSFELTQKAPKMFLMTREEVQRAYAASDWKTEYGATHTPVPSKRLTNTIRFPPSHHALMPAPMPICFVGDSEVVHRSLTEKLKEYFIYEKGMARLDVPNPIPGLTYAIAWMPPPPVQSRQTSLPINPDPSA